MHLAVGDDVVVKQDKIMCFSFTEEKNGHKSFAIKSNIRTLDEFSVKIDLLNENIDVASVREHVEEKQPTQMQVVKYAAKILTLEEGKKCFQMNKVVEFVNFMKIQQEKRCIEDTPVICWNATKRIKTTQVMEQKL